MILGLLVSLWQNNSWGMTMEAFQENTAVSKHLGNLHDLWTGTVWDDWYLEGCKAEDMKKKKQEKAEGLKLKSDFILDPWDAWNEVWREKRRWRKFWLDFSSTLFSSISIAHYHKFNLRRSSLPSSLIYHHLHFISKELKRGSLFRARTLRGWKQAIQPLWYQSIITFHMARHPWMI